METQTWRAELGTVGDAEGGMDWQSSTETYTLPCVKQIASGNLLNDPGSSNLVLCDNLEGWDGMESGREVEREGPCVFLWLVHADIGQKSTQYCKAIILHLKINLKIF